MKQHIKLVMVCIFVTTLAACSSSPSITNDVAPAPNSKFAKLKTGMSQKQVEDLIGAPDDIKTGVGGKAFIPIYNLIGNDTTYTHHFYKSEGVLTFSGGVANMVGDKSGRLTRIMVDTTEDGYNN